MGGKLLKGALKHYLGEFVDIPKHVTTTSTSSDCMGAIIQLDNLTLKHHNINKKFMSGMPTLEIKKGSVNSAKVILSTRLEEWSLCLETVHVYLAIGEKNLKQSLSGSSFGGFDEDDSLELKDSRDSLDSSNDFEGSFSGSVEDFPEDMDELVFLEFLKKSISEILGKIERAEIKDLHFFVSEKKMNDQNVDTFEVVFSEVKYERDNAKKNIELGQIQAFWHGKDSSQPQPILVSTLDGVNKDETVKDLIELTFSPSEGGASQLSKVEMILNSSFQFTASPLILSSLSSLVFSFLSGPRGNETRTKKKEKPRMIDVIVVLNILDLMLYYDDVFPLDVHTSSCLHLELDILQMRYYYEDQSMFKLTLQDLNLFQFSSLPGSVVEVCHLISCCECCTTNTIFHTHNLKYRKRETGKCRSCKYCTEGNMSVECSEQPISLTVIKKMKNDKEELEISSEIQELFVVLDKQILDRIKQCYERVDRLTKEDKEDKEGAYIEEIGRIEKIPCKYSVNLQTNSLNFFWNETNMMDRSINEQLRLCCQGVAFIGKQDIFQQDIHWEAKFSEAKCIVKYSKENTDKAKPMFIIRAHDTYIPTISLATINKERDIKGKGKSSVDDFVDLLHSQCTTSFAYGKLDNSEDALFSSSNFGLSVELPYVRVNVSKQEYTTLKNFVSEISTVMSTHNASYQTDPYQDFSVEQRKSSSFSAKVSIHNLAGCLSSKLNLEERIEIKKLESVHVFLALITGEDEPQTFFTLKTVDIDDVLTINQCFHKKPKDTILVRKPKSEILGKGFSLPHDPVLTIMGSMKGKKVKSRILLKDMTLKYTRQLQWPWIAALIDFFSTNDPKFGNKNGKNEVMEESIVEEDDMIPVAKKKHITIELFNFCFNYFPFLLPSALLLTIPYCKFVFSIGTNKLKVDFSVPRMKCKNAELYICKNISNCLAYEKVMDCRVPVNIKYIQEDTEPNKIEINCENSDKEEKKEKYKREYLKWNFCGDSLAVFKDMMNELSFSSDELTQHKLDVDKKLYAADDEIVTEGQENSNEENNMEKLDESYEMIPVSNEETLEEDFESDFVMVEADEDDTTFVYTSDKEKFSESFLNPVLRFSSYPNSTFQVALKPVNVQIRLHAGYDWPDPTEVGRKQCRYVEIRLKELQVRYDSFEENNNTDSDCCSSRIAVVVHKFSLVEYGEDSSEEKDCNKNSNDDHTDSNKLNNESMFSSDKKPVFSYYKKKVSAVDKPMIMLEIENYKGTQGNYAHLEGNIPYPIRLHIHESLLRFMFLGKDCFFSEKHQNELVPNAEPMIIKKSTIEKLRLVVDYHGFRYDKDLPNLIAGNKESISLLTYVTSFLLCLSETGVRLRFKKVEVYDCIGFSELAVKATNEYILLLKNNVHSLFGGLFGIRTVRAVGEGLYNMLLLDKKQ